MTLKEMKQDDFVIEYGSLGDEFYVIIEGECEILIPDGDGSEFKQIDFELKCCKQALEKNLSEVKLFSNYGRQLTINKQF